MPQKGKVDTGLPGGACVSCARPVPFTRPAMQRILSGISLLNKAQLPEALSHLSHLPLPSRAPFADTGLINGVTSIETTGTSLEFPEASLLHC